ncbi:hypothetical protein MMC30_004481 [Trapelia coarctata]|nr:hypothetical protein [Trapelia coarctata]
MFVARLLPFLPLLSYIFSTAVADAFWSSIYEAGDVLFCDVGTNTPRPPKPADCLTAIEMIPQGLKPLDPDQLERIGQPNAAKPVSLDLDKRKYVVPAAFRSGNCVVRVWARAVYRASRHPPLTSGFLYFNIWPRVRKMAPEVVNRCIVGSRERGSYLFRTETDGSVLEWNVDLDFIKSGQRVTGAHGNSRITGFNVYMAEKHGMTLRGGRK